MRISRFLLVLLAISLVFSAGCKRRPAQVDNKINPQFTVGVAPFAVAHEPWELIAGYMPEKTSAPKADSLDDVNAALLQVMNVTPERNVVSGAKAKACVESVRRSPEANRMATLKYWQEVGKCMDAQYILVPMVVHWKERQGSAAGSHSPAWVILDFFLINVKTGGVSHYHYDYAQKALADNLLEAGDFLKRKGQWVTAADLAREGMAKAIKEFGLQ